MQMIKKILIIFNLLILSVHTVYAIQEDAMAQITNNEITQSPEKESEPWGMIESGAFIINKDKILFSLGTNSIVIPLDDEEDVTFYPQQESKTIYTQAQDKLIVVFSKSAYPGLVKMKQELDFMAANICGETYNPPVANSLSSYVKQVERLESVVPFEQTGSYKKFNGAPVKDNRIRAEVITGHVTGNLTKVYSYNAIPSDISMVRKPGCNAILTEDNGANHRFYTRHGTAVCSYLYDALNSDTRITVQYMLSNDTSTSRIVSVKPG